MNNRAEYKNNFYISLGVLVLYIVLRFLVYSNVYVDNNESWILRDTVMNLPRAVCLILIILFVLKIQNLKKDFSPAHKWNLPLIITAGSIVCLALLRPAFFNLIEASLGSLILAVGSSFIVGFFEEALFRGAIFDSLKNWKGDVHAIWYSALLFMLFHIQAQNFGHFPLIFLMGLLFTFLRRGGSTIFQLSIVHALYDAIVVLWTPSVQRESAWRIFECSVIVVLIVCYLIFSKNKQVKLLPNEKKE